jgi:formylglycine-generating enzyme required for sulfatase activity
MRSRRRVLRGGSWYNDPCHLRSACRGGGSTVDLDDNVGFRVARAVP